MKQICPTQWQRKWIEDCKLEKNEMIDWKARSPVAHVVFAEYFIWKCKTQEDSLRLHKLSFIICHCLPSLYWLYRSQASILVNLSKICFDWWNSFVNLHLKAQTGSSFSFHETLYIYSSKGFFKNQMFLKFKLNSKCNGKLNIVHWLDFTIRLLNTTRI